MIRITKTIVLTVAVALVAHMPLCLKAQEKMTLTPRLQTLSVVAALEAKGDIEGLRNALNEGFDNGLTVSEAKEALAQGVVGLSRRIGRSIEALKFRTGADPIDALANLGSVNEAILYNPEKAAELAAEFIEGYNNLPEILKKQPRLNSSDIEWFLNHCGWNLK